MEEILLFPACAGVIPFTNSPFQIVYAFPRMCGGDPMLEQLAGLLYAFSPHVRG